MSEATSFELTSKNRDKHSDATFIPMHKDTRNQFLDAVKNFLKGADGASWLTWIMTDPEGGSRKTIRDRFTEKHHRPPAKFVQQNPDESVVPLEAEPKSSDSTVPLDQAPKSSKTPTIDSQLWKVLGYVDRFDPFGSDGLKEAQKSRANLKAVMAALRKLRQGDEENVVTWLRTKENSKVEKQFDLYLRGLKEKGKSYSLTDGSTRKYAKYAVGSNKPVGGSRLNDEERARLINKQMKAIEQKKAGKTPRRSVTLAEWAIRANLKYKVINDLVQSGASVNLATNDNEMAMEGLVKMLSDSTWGRKVVPYLKDDVRGDVESWVIRKNLRNALRKYVGKNYDKNDYQKILRGIPSS